MKRKTRLDRLMKVRQLAERLRLSGYGERLYEHTQPELAQGWRQSGDEAEAELVRVIIETF